MYYVGIDVSKCSLDVCLLAEGSKGSRKTKTLSNGHYSAQILAKWLILQKCEPLIISEMQRKLATWAATDLSRRIERLLRLITQPEWPAEAARITLSSKGAHTSGVDGVNKAKLQLSCKSSGMNYSPATTSPCQPDEFTSLKATASCDHWVSG
ncbi:Retron-type reverse transcriptase [Klebsiella variicola]|uniref:Retron-type reverse transcriptase n=1 Tax=Klebsiella variicola TaxID=244366 RepID=A0ABD7P9F9_KLEVA|nr:Retron-type reverse transcriptase [Klebsiella variicola]SXF96388.1 Retron-type reverse transcriptase [Klebsiella variicola]